MAQTIPYQDIDPRPIHSDYQSVWSGSFSSSPELIKDIWENPRFARRIETALLQQQFGHCDCTPIGNFDPKKELLSKFLAASQDMVLRKAGIAWFGPKLASELLKTSGRKLAGELSKDEVKLAIRYKNHCPADRIKDDFDAAAYQAQGLACFVAWLSPLPRSIVDRLRLTLPLSSAREIDEFAMRVALFSQILEEVFK